MRNHTKLSAFELADDLALKTYNETSQFPKQELGIASPAFCLLIFKKLQNRKTGAVSHFGAPVSQSGWTEEKIFPKGGLSPGP